MPAAPAGVAAGMSRVFARPATGAFASTRTTLVTGAVVRMVGAFVRGLVIGSTDPLIESVLRPSMRPAVAGRVRATARAMSRTARTVPRTEPETFDRPPARGRYATSTSRMRHRAAPARMSSSRG